MELRAIGPDGFDTNSFMHFRVLSNYGLVASRLVCPGDIARSVATNFGGLGPGKRHLSGSARLIRSHSTNPERFWRCAQLMGTRFIAMVRSRLMSLSCLDNLRDVGLSLRTWAMDNRPRFPFHVSTNWGGTLELRALGADGFDTNSFIHFMVVSNELSVGLAFGLSG